MATAPASPRHPADVLGIVAVILSAALVIPTLLVYVVGLVPEMNGIWWMGIMLLPLLFADGVLVIVLPVIGLIVAARRAGRRAWSVPALGVGILMLIPALLVLMP